MADDDADFLDELIAESTARDPNFPALMEAALQRRRAARARQADETPPLAELRQALDDAVLTHTGRSIGDQASQRVLDDIMPYIAALQRAEVDRLTAEHAILADVLACSDTDTVEDHEMLDQAHAIMKRLFKWEN